MKNFIIGTHDSATGEKGRGFISWLVIPFAKTQTYTIRQQFLNGVRYFDIRIKKYKGTWYCGHGLWTSKKSAYYILCELNNLAKECVENVYINIAYEGKIKSELERVEFIKYVKEAQKTFNFLKLSGVAIKWPKWEEIKLDGMESAPYPLIHLFKTLDGRSWHTFMPIPWLWNKFYRGNIQEFKTNLMDFFE